MKSFSTKENATQNYSLENGVETWEIWKRTHQTTRHRKIEAKKSGTSM